MTSNIENVKYELWLSETEANAGVNKLLIRNDRRLDVIVPPGTRDGTMVKLPNALQITDGRAGDIIILIKIKKTAGVVTVDEGSFGGEVLKSELPVVVDFWAPWCGPCRMIAPVMEKLSAEYGGRIKFCKVNVDENPQLAAEYKAMSIPMLVFFKNGVEIGRSVGALPEPVLRAKIREIFG
jgi:thioredoxin 1